MGMDYNAMSMGMSGISTALGAWSQYQQGRAEKKRMDYQARMQDLRADRIEYRGEWEEQRLREKGSQVKGAQRASYAASGVQVDTGSPLDILASTDLEVERDAAMIQYNSAMEAGAARQQGGLYRAAGRTAKSGSLLRSGSTLLTGGSKLAMQYNDFYGNRDGD